MSENKGRTGGRNERVSAQTLITTLAQGTGKGPEARERDNGVSKLGQETGSAMSG